MSFQNANATSPSTILPSARSLSATHARGVHQPADVPSRVIVRQDDHHEIRHLARSLPNRARCARMSPAFTTSGTSCVQPGYSRTSSRSSDGMSECVL